MLFVRQILRTSTRVAVPNAAALRAPIRMASTTVGGTSTDLRSEKTNPAQVQKPDDNRKANNSSGQKSSQNSEGSNQQNTNAGSGKGKQ
ncbi:hypothetical protein PG996_013082 [Apiospora saccharicola]|uniref:Uncharacterized protein n=1 Tax=Apiospora saccharicola TaxID=335842 RepID=A0ABR1U6K8_9PEZI